MKKIFTFLIVLVIFMMCSCGNTNDSVDPETGKTPGQTETSNLATYTNVHPISYREVNKETDMDKFYQETKKSNGSSHDAPHDYGFVSSVWHKLKVNDKEVKVYSARCGYGIHSFAWVDIETDGEFSLDIEYFKSNADQYIFYLVELDGKTQATKLGISKLMYHNADLAKKWYRQIAKIIHPDITKHPKSEEAMSVLNDIYKKMMPDG